MIDDLENLIKTWKERCTYLGLQAKEAFNAKDIGRQDILMNNKKQIQNSIDDLQAVLDKEN